MGKADMEPDDLEQTVTSRNARRPVAEAESESEIDLERTQIETRKEPVMIETQVVTNESSDTVTGETTDAQHVEKNDEVEAADTSVPVSSRVTDNDGSFTDTSQLDAAKAAAAKAATVATAIAIPSTEVYQSANGAWKFKGHGICKGQVKTENEMIVGVYEESTDRWITEIAISHGVYQYQILDSRLILWSNDENGGPDIILRFDELDDCAKFCEFLLETCSQLEQVNRPITMPDEDEKDTVIPKEGSRDPSTAKTRRIESNEVHGSLNHIDASGQEATWDEQAEHHRNGNHVGMNNNSDIEALENDQSHLAHVIKNISLPEIRIENICDILRTLMKASEDSYKSFQPVRVTFPDNFIDNLLVCFAETDDLDMSEERQVMCEILKLLIFLCDTCLITDTLAKNERILSVLGMFDYSIQCQEKYPEFFQSHAPTEPEGAKITLREAMKRKLEDSRATDIKDEVVQDAICKAGFLTLFQDSVLCQIADEFRWTHVKAKITDYYIIILQYLCHSEKLGQEMFALFDDDPMEGAEQRALQDSKDNNEQQERRRERVKFIYCMIEIAKSQGTDGSQIFKKFLQSGLLKAVKFTLDDTDSHVCGLGIDMLTKILEHDINILRFDKDGQYFEQVIDILIDMLRDGMISVKLQTAETLKSLLDTRTTRIGLGGPGDLAWAGEGLSQYLMKSAESQKFEQNFYRLSAAKLFSALTEKHQEPQLTDSTKNAKFQFSHKITIEKTCDLLSFCLDQHEVIFYGPFCSQHNLWSRINIGLIQEAKKSPSVKLAVLRSIRQGMGILASEEEDLKFRQDMVNSGILDSVIKQLVKLGNVNNMLHSGYLSVLCALEMVRNKEEQCIRNFIDRNKSILEMELSYVEISKSLLNLFYNEDNESRQAIKAGRTNSSMTEADALDTMESKDGEIKYLRSIDSQNRDSESEDDEDSQHNKINDQDKKNKRPYLRRNSSGVGVDAIRKRQRSNNLL